MENPVDQERLNDYQNRIAEWIGNQGVFFQLRYARTVGAQSIFKQLGNLFVKLGILLVLLAGLGYFLVERHFASEDYASEMSKGVKEALGADEVEGMQFTRSKGTGGFGDLEVTGGDESFFFNAVFENLNAPLDYLTGVTTGWEPDSVKIEKAEIDLKAGGSQDEMETAFQGVMKSLDGSGLNVIRIEDLSFDWGYSKLTYGRIANTDFKATLDNKRWKVEIKGGSFQQNWLNGFLVEKGVFYVGVEGVEVETLDLIKGNGRLSLTGKIGGPLSRPTFELSGPFTGLPVDRLIQLDGVTTREFIEGSMSGNLTVSGSSNRRIKISGSVVLQDGDRITIRERWPILKGISIIDTNRTYRRIVFNEGAFKFSTEGGGMELTEVKMLAKDTARLEGNLKTRLPSQREAADALGIKLTEGFSKDLTDSSAAQKLEDERMSLRKAAGGGSRVDDVKLDRSLTDDPSESRESESEIDGRRLRAEMKVHRVTGLLKLGIPKSSFDENEYLDKLYRPDSQGWRWIEMDLQTSFTKISTEAYDRLLDQGKGRGLPKRIEEGD